jgi:hypothetical protein
MINFYVPPPGSPLNGSSIELRVKYNADGDVEPGARALYLMHLSLPLTWTPVWSPWIHNDSFSSELYLLHTYSTLYIGWKENIKYNNPAPVSTLGIVMHTHFVCSCALPFICSFKPFPPPSSLLLREVPCTSISMLPTVYIYSVRVNRLQWSIRIYEWMPSWPFPPSNVLLSFKFQKIVV